MNMKHVYVRLTRPLSGYWRCRLFGWLPSQVQQAFWDDIMIEAEFERLRRLRER